MFASDMKSGSPSLFPVTTWRPKVELSLMCACAAHYRHKSRRKWCRIRNGRDFTGKRVRWIQMTSDFKSEVVIWSKLLMCSKNHQNGEKQRGGLHFMTYKKSMSLDKFSVRYLRQEVELMHL